MVLPDVNVLLYAFRTDAPNHEAYRDWLNGLISADTSFAVTDLTLSAFLRIATHPRIFDPPTPLSKAILFAEALRSEPNCIVIAPGNRHWSVFCKLCREANARGNLIPDAYLAALAIESGCILATTDRDFSRFADLQWRCPVS